MPIQGDGKGLSSLDISFFLQVIRHIISKVIYRIPSLDLFSIFHLSIKGFGDGMVHEEMRIYAILHVDAK